MKELISGFITTARSPREGLRLRVIRQFMKFSSVGVLNTLTSASVYELMKKLFGLPPLSANAFAFFAGVTVSYFLNKRWTFRVVGGRHAVLYSRFFAVNIGGFLISEGVIFILHNLFGLHDRIAFFSSVAVVVFWNFNVNRAWTFKGHDHVASSTEN